MALDGQGGAYVAWQGQGVPGFTGDVQHLTANGAVAPGWPAHGVALGPTASASYEYFDVRITADGQGGAIVVWDGSSPGFFDAVFAQRFVADGPVPVELSLVSAEAKDGVVTLDWYAVNAASLAATVQRRTAASYWVPLGTASADGSGHIRYQDRTVVVGGRYAYRLGYSDGGAEQFTQETWVDVPAPKLALDGLRPNPAVGAMAVSFSLPNAGPASLEVVDVSGRRVAARDVGSLGVGSHLVQLTETSALKPGIYWLRLRQGDRALLTRGAIVR